MAINISMKSKINIRPMLDRMVNRSNLAFLENAQGLKRHIIVLRILVLMLCLVIGGLTAYIISMGKF